MHNPSDDSSRRFLFEEADIRGETVNLREAYREILAIHQYAPGVSRLLGEFLAAAVLLSTNLKFEGRMIIQAKSEGQIPLLMAECNHLLEVRAIAQGAEEATADGNERLLTQGHLAITIDPDDGQRYQGIVPLQPDSLAASLDAYFEQSEQLHTRIWLAADGERAAGILLQQLPAQLIASDQERLQHWEHACTLASTVSSAELLELDTPDLLYRLYHQDSLRLFDPAQVRSHCNCSQERSLNALSCLGAAELDTLLKEVGTIVMDCEFCNQQYRFERADLSSILDNIESKTLH